VSSVVVSGLVLPVAVGGHPALDFCNTRAGWGSPAPKEYLSSYDHFAVWTREVGMFGHRDALAIRRAARTDPAAAQAVLVAALALREAAHSVLLGSRSSPEFSVVLAQVYAARAASILRRSPPGELRIAGWALPVDGIDPPLLAVAAQLDDLMCSPLSGVVAACPGVGCGWLFADPRRRRRWCDMAVCGNRAKARKYAERRAARRNVN
jgi:predicted RNA-binding Zn ribbon-like protein